MTRVLTLTSKAHDVLWRSVFSTYEHEWLVWAALQGALTVIGVNLF